MTEKFLQDRVTLLCGDCLERLAELSENSVDAAVTDPPYHLLSTVKRFAQTAQSDATDTSDRARRGADSYARLSRGFMGKQWDGGDVAFRPETWAAVLRVMKPGAHLAAFAAPKNSHRMVCAIEDAGFEIRDTIAWLFGSGFPKSHNVSKGIDRTLGAERPTVGEVRRWGNAAGKGRGGQHANNYEPTEPGAERFDSITGPGSAAAAEWEGWGTALKPAYEPIILARKPLSEKTVAANVLRWRTGALNIDATRVGMAAADAKASARPGHKDKSTTDSMFGTGKQMHAEQNAAGRWPANVAHDGSDEVTTQFPYSASGSGTIKRETGSDVEGNRGPAYGKESRPAGTPMISHGDEGSAARFFYTAKADSDDRLGSKHPTVKPLDLMQWLVRLVTPLGGLILDPFAGTGTTGEAAWREGAHGLLIEREAEYQADIRRRMALCLSGPDERARESIKAKLAGKPEDHGPLFEERR